MHIATVCIRLLLFVRMCVTSILKCVADWFILAQWLCKQVGIYTFNVCECVHVSHSARGTAVSAYSTHQPSPHSHTHINTHLRSSLYSTHAPHQIRHQWKTEWKTTERAGTINRATEGQKVFAIQYWSYKSKSALTRKSPLPPSYTHKHIHFQISTFINPQNSFMTEGKYVMRDLEYLFDIAMVIWKAINGL